MNFAVEFLRTHAGFALNGLVAILWYVFLLESEFKSYLRLVAFPIGHLRVLLDPRGQPAAIPIAFCYLLFIGGIASLISAQDARVYLAGWCLLVLYELNAIAAYFLRPRRQRMLSLLSALFVLAVGYVAMKIVQQESFQLLNDIDFVVQIYLFIGSVAAIVGIIVKDRFAKAPEALFVFFGLIIYSFLQILATIMLAFDFVQNFNYAYYATLITLLFWLANIPWIKHIRTKLS